LFVEVVHTRSFTKAAARLDMPASTLSRRISALEREIGLRLLNRTTRRVEVSDAGGAYYARCAPLVEQARVAHEQLAETVSRATGTLRLACSADFATFYMGPLLVAFTQRHPQVDVELDLSPRPVDLVAENVDAALRIGPLADSSLVARPIAKLQLGLYAAPDYLALAAAPREPDDLAAHVCIRLRADTRNRLWQLSPVDGGRPRTVSVTGRFVSGSIAMTRQLALLGAGIGAVDETMAHDDLTRGRLRRVLPGWRLPPVALTLLTPSRLMPARVRLFGDFLVERLGRGPQERPGSDSLQR
jgi:DNA-binding transcriptional LysR family regulator